MDREHKGKEVMELMELNSVGDLNKYIWSNTMIVWPPIVNSFQGGIENSWK